MADDVIINKAASIERCVARAREEYFKSISKIRRHSVLIAPARMRPS